MIKKKSPEQMTQKKVITTKDERANVTRTNEAKEKVTRTNDAKEKSH